MRSRILLVVLVLGLGVLAGAASAEQVVNLWASPQTGGEQAAAANGSVWVVDDSRDTVSRWDPGLGGQLILAVRVEGFDGAYGIAVNPGDGSCWVGDCCTNEVVHLAADGTVLSRTSGFDRPESLSVNETDDSVWVADCGGRLIKHLAAEDGSVISSSSPYGSSFAPKSISVDSSDGTVWVGDRCSDSVLHFQENLDCSVSLISATSGYQAVCSVSADSANNTVWAADSCSGQVLHLEEGDGATNTLSTTAFSTNNWVQVAAVAADSTAWVSSYDDFQLAQVNADGTLGLTIDSLPSPLGVAVDASDQSFWALTADGADMTHYDASGTVLQGQTSIGSPEGIGMNPLDGSVWVADDDAGRVVHLTGDGGQIGSAVGFSDLYPLAVNPVDGSVWVANCCDGEIVHLDADGSELSRTPGFDEPYGLAVDPNTGSCWVADCDNSLVTRLDADGNVAFETSFYVPTALAVDPKDGSVWVNDACNGEVTHFTEGEEGSVNTISYFELPNVVNSLVVDTADSSCLGAPDDWSGVDTFGVPVLRFVDTPTSEEPQVLTLGGFYSPRSVALNPRDRSIWVGGEYEVGHMTADGTVLSRLVTFCCPEFLAVDPNDGACWVSDAGRDQVIKLAVVMEADFSASGNSGVAPFGVSFTDLSAGYPTSWCWDFGDGATSTEQNPTHTYLGGLYTVSLTVTGAAGSDTETKPNYIYAGGLVPGAAFSATPTSGPAPLTVAFSDLSTNYPTSWLWSFGDGATSTDQNPTHTYTVAGTYAVSLLAGTNEGYDLEVKSNYITVEPFFADFTADVTRGPAPLEVGFQDTSEATATSWLWNFGDGDTSVLQNPIHTYDTPGFYDVTLTIGKGGAFASRTREGVVAVGFTDTPGNEWSFDAQIACYEAGIVQGYEDGSYDPTGEVTRAQMATYIARALAGGDAGIPTAPAEATFDDVPNTGYGNTGTDAYWAYKYIEYCVDQGVAEGYDNGTFDPEGAVNRGQMAVFVARASADPVGEEGLADYTPPTNPSFSDVTPDSPDWGWCYKYVEYCAANHIVEGYAGGTYEPESLVLRDQMAVFIQRALHLPVPTS